jgi:hypothetical protein
MSFATTPAAAEAAAAEVVANARKFCPVQAGQKEIISDPNS